MIKHSFFKSILPLLLMFFTGTLCAENIQGIYRLSDDGKTLLGVTDKNRINYSIPSGITTIGDRAFENCPQLNSITVPSGVTTIGKNAFANCYGLRTVKLPNSLQLIDDRAFCNCMELTAIVIPNRVKRIGKWAFGDCRAATVLKLSADLETIDDGAFGRCEKVSQIIIPDKVKRIGSSAFFCCISAKILKISAAAEIIADEAFYNCRNIKQVTLPKKLHTIGSYAFFRISAPIHVPKSVKAIGVAAFSDSPDVTLAPGIKNFYIYKKQLLIDQVNKVVLWASPQTYSCQVPTDMKIIGDCAFSLARQLTDVTLPQGLEAIKYGALGTCSVLKEVILPNSLKLLERSSLPIQLPEVKIPANVQTIHYGAFTGAGSVKLDPGNQHFYMDKDRALFSSKEKNLIWCNPKLKVYNIPHGTNVIAGCAFAYCSDITAIQIPDSVTGIGYNAFLYCKSLEELYIPDSVKNMWLNLYGADNLQLLSLPSSCDPRDVKRWNIPKNCQVEYR